MTAPWYEGTLDGTPGAIQTPMFNLYDDACGELQQGNQGSDFDLFPMLPNIKLEEKSSSLKVKGTLQGIVRYQKNASEGLKKKNKKKGMASELKKEYQLKMTAAPACDREYSKILPPIASPDYQTECEGFDQLQETLNAAVHTAHSNGTSLGESFTLISDWLSRFYGEADIRTMGISLSKYLSDTILQTRKYQLPCNPRCYAVCVVLDFILCCTARTYFFLTPLIEDVRKEIYSLIFFNPDVDSISEFNNKFEANGQLSSQNQSTYVGTFKDKKTYFQACRMLSKSLCSKGISLSEAESSKDKVAGSMERIAKYWKSHLLRVLFRGWRHAIQTQKTTQRTNDRVSVLEKEVTNLEARISYLQRTVSQQKTEHQTKETMLKKHVDAQAEKIICDRDEKRCLKKEAEAMLSNHQTTVSNLKLKLDKKREKHKKLIEMIDEVRVKLTGSEYEANLRSDFKELLEDNNSDPATLLLWCNRMLHYSKSYDVIYEIHDFCSGSKSILSYWMLLSVMSPKHVPRQQLKKALANPNPNTNTISLIKKTEEMGIQHGLVADDLLGDPCAEQHELFITSLFSRFCGASPPTVEFGIPEVKPDKNALTLPKSTEEVSPTVCDSDSDRGEVNSSEDSPVVSIINSINQNRKTAEQWSNVASKIQQTVLTRVTVAMKTGTSSGLSAAEYKDKTQFTSLNDDATGMMTSSVEENDVKEILNKNFRKLRKVFRYYAVGKHEGPDATMSLDEFWRMINDSKVIDKGFTREMVRNAFKQANTQTADKTLDPDEWITALLSIAGAKQKKNTSSSISDKLQVLLERYILMYCCGAETHEFKAAIYQPAVQEVVVSHKIKLKKIFKHYSSLNEKHKQQQADNEMSYSEIAQLVRDINAFDVVCTHQALEQMHTTLHGDHTSREGSGLLYHEFTEMVCGLAAFKFPAPYIPLYMKVERFVETWLSKVKFTR